MSKVLTDEAKIHLATKVDNMESPDKKHFYRNGFLVVTMNNYNPADMDSAYGGKYLKALVEALKEKKPREELMMGNIFSFVAPLVYPDQICEHILKVTGFKGKTGLE